MISIQNEDSIVVISFLKRLENQNDFFKSLPESLENLSNPEQSVWVKDNVRKLLTEASLMELSDFIPIFSEIYNIFDTAIPNVEFEEKSILKDNLNKLIDYLFSFCNKTLTVIKDNQNSGNDIIVELESDDITDLVRVIKEILKQFKGQNFFDISEKKNEVSKETLARFVHELNHLLSDVNVLANTYISSPDNHAFEEYALSFEQIKGNIDLVLASMDNLPEDNHPLMKLHEVANTIDNLNQKTLRKENINQPSYIPVQEIFTIIPNLIEDLESNKNSSNVSIENVTKKCNEIVISLKSNVNQTVIIDEPIIKPVIEAKVEIVKESVENSEPVKASVIEESKNTSSKDGSKENIVEKKEDEIFVRVRQDYLENLTNMIGELVVAKSTLSLVKTKIQLNDEKFSILESLESTEKMFNRVIGEIDNTVMMVRLQKVKEVFSRFPRMIRDIAKNSGKKIELEISGEELELDNIILKQIGDPLMHLIRNSCDHGIETPAERLQKGKSEIGKINLKASIHGQKMSIVIEDDGKGLDDKVLINKALEKGLISEIEAEKMTPQQAYQLIFMPGFSTASVVTEISGRGVGMDVVFQNIQKVKGDIKLLSEKDKYTRIILNLPLTISVSKGLLIGLGMDKYIIPLENIVSIEHIEKSEIHKFQDGFFIKYKKLMLGFRHLGQILNSDSKNTFLEKEKIITVVLDINSEFKALAIDEIFGIQELSIKPLPESLKDMVYYRGCSIMADGKAIIVLNTIKLFNN